MARNSKASNGVHEEVCLVVWGAVTRTPVAALEGKQEQAVKAYKENATIGPLVDRLERKLVDLDIKCALKEGDK